VTNETIRQWSLKFGREFAKRIRRRAPRRGEQWELTFSGVYRVASDLGAMSLLIGDFVLPNGLAFSPDGTVNLASTD
jgi:sugar lactone lactonase YvrE